MAQIKVKFFKVTGLPSEPEANAFYFVENDDFAEMYLTDADGEIKATGNSAMTLALLTWNNVSDKPATFPPSAHTHTWSIGDTVTNATQHAIPFFGAAGVWAQNSSRFRYENIANNERFFVSGRKADGAFRFEFDGYSSESGYTTGIYLKSTSAGGYFPRFIEMENVAYSTKFNFGVGPNRFYFANDMYDAAFVFNGYSGNYEAVIINVGGGSFASPRLKVKSNATTDIIAEYRAFAGQTANIWEHRDASNNILTALTASGAILIPIFADDSVAPESSIFWNEANNRLCYKKPLGELTYLS